VVFSRRRAIIAGVTASAALGAAGCSRETKTPALVSDLGGLVANARDFGINGGKADESRPFQEAIDFAQEHGLALYLPAGSYTADGLVLRDRTRLIGAGPETSVIHAVPGSKNRAVLNISSGAVQGVLVEAVGLEAAGNEEQHGIHVFARRGRGDVASGLWHSDFKNVRVYNFGGAQMWLQGGGSDARDPVQFLTLQNVVLERRHDSTRSIGLLMSGQVNQTVWLGGRIDGFGSPGDHPGVNVKLCRQLDHYDPLTDGSTEYISNRSGHTHLFSGVTFQQAQLAVYVDKADSLTFDTCHFEDLDSGLLFSHSGQNRVDRSHFANSALGQEEPFSIRAINGATVSGSSNVFIGEYGYMASADDSDATVVLSNTLGSDPAITRNLTRRIDSAITINIGGATTVILNASPTPVRVVTSSLFPGERVVFKASGGSVFFESGGNIDFEGTSPPIEILAGGTLTLARFDSGPDWCIEAMHRSR
jgi:Pectate lyase superfamily protein